MNILLSILSIAKSNTPLAIIILLSAIVGYQNLADSRYFVWADTIPYWKNVAADLEDEITDYEFNIERLQHVITLQNDQITQLSTQSQAVQTELDEALAQIQQSRQKAAEKLDQVDGETVTDPIQYLRDSAIDLQWPGTAR